jgi:hypothetical protein
MRALDLFCDPRTVVRNLMVHAAIAAGERAAQPPRQAWLYERCRADFEKRSRERGEVGAVAESVRADFNQHFRWAQPRLE